MSLLCKGFSFYLTSLTLILMMFLHPPQKKKKSSDLKLIQTKNKECAVKLHSEVKLS